MKKWEITPATGNADTSKRRRMIHLSRLVTKMKNTVRVEECGRCSNGSDVVIIIRHLERRRLLDSLLLARLSQVSRIELLTGLLGQLVAIAIVVSTWRRRRRWYTRVSFEGQIWNVSVTDQSRLDVAATHSLSQFIASLHYPLLYSFVICKTKSTFMAEDRKKGLTKNAKDYYICMCGRGRVGCHTKTPNRQATSKLCTFMGYMVLAEADKGARMEVCICTSASSCVADG